MPLYKYTSTAFIEHLLDCTIRFSPPGEFNDPFDGIPQAKAILNSSAYVKARKQFLPFDENQLKQDSDLRARVQIADDILEKKTLYGYRDRLIDTLDSDFRILCLTKTAPQSEAAALMWGHYATHTETDTKGKSRTRSHAGIALEFDETHPWFTEHRTRRDRAYDEVEYRSLRAEIETDGRKSLFVKSPPWAYEQEVRLVRCIKDSANDLITPDKILAAYPPEILKAIYIGLKGAPDLEKRIAEKLSKTPDLKYVKVRRITGIDPNGFNLHASV